MKTASLVAAFLATFIATVALSQESSYKGDETRAIKALSGSDVDGYLAGSGMGFGKVAELNHYPGPRHVIDMAGDLGLSDEQLSAAQAAFDAMHASAVELGTKLVEKERELDALFASGKADGDNASALIDEIAAIQGKLRFAHVGAHVAMRSILTPEQVKRYDELRGYAGH
jgi:Spy/CpxP family protein refolding chaperone